MVNLIPQIYVIPTLVVPLRAKLLLVHCCQFKCQVTSCQFGTNVYVCVCVYLLREVEGGDAQGPEAAEHGEKGEAQVVLRDHQGEVALAVAIAEVFYGRVLRAREDPGERSERTLFHMHAQD